MAPGRWRRQRGITLLEVLASIVVLALGLLGILGVQMRTLADTQTSVRRAQAIRLIEDLSERIRANPNALPTGVLSQYLVSWDDADDPGDCDTAASGCASANLASQQIKAWKQSVKNNLPGGNAMTFIPPTSQQQLGVLVSWRQNERDAAADYTGVFSGTATATATDATDANCQEGRTCHLQFISVTGRCPVDASSGASLVFCSAGIATLPAVAPPDAPP